MRLLFNTIALLLATTVLAAPVPSRSSDALTDGASANEHTLTHHHHVHHSKHAKHTPPHEEAEVEARSLFNDELEERSFYDAGYTQLERRVNDKDKGKGKANPLRILTSVKNIVKPKPKTSPSTPSSGSSFVHVNTPSDHRVSPLHLGPSHAGPSNHAANSKAAEAHRNKPLPPLPHSPVRSNTMPAPASLHHGAPPPYSQHANDRVLHVVNPGSSHSGSVRQPHRANTVGSVNSPHLSDSSSITWHSASTGSSVAGSPVRHSP